MLQYRIKRYQAMGNGAMSQTLNGKLQKTAVTAGSHVNKHIIVLKKARNFEYPRFFYICTQ